MTKTDIENLKPVPIQEALQLAFDAGCAYTISSHRDFMQIHESRETVVNALSNALYTNKDYQEAYVEEEQSMDISTRIQIEKDIATKIISDAIDLGYKISVDDGRQYVVRNSTDKKNILGAMFSVDDEYLVFTDPYNDRRIIGNVYLVYGNSGWDVICDHTLNDKMSEILKGAIELCDEYEATSR